MRRAIIAAVLLALFLCTGCSYSVKLDPNIDPTANISNKIDYDVGVFVPQSVKKARIADSSDWAHKYTFEIGEAVDAIVCKSLARVFAGTVLLDANPTELMTAESNLDAAVVVKLSAANVAINKKEGFFQNDADGSAHISVQLTFYDEEMLEIGVVHASGSGVASEGLGPLTTGKDEYSTSVKHALRNLGDDLIHQIYGNYLIRKKAEEMATVEGMS